MPAPYVRAAVFVERVLTELDGVNKLVRVVNCINMAAPLIPGTPLCGLT